MAKKKKKKLIQGRKTRKAEGETGFRKEDWGRENISNHEKGVDMRRGPWA